MGINVFPTDLIVIGGYIFLDLVIGLYFRKRHKNSEEYFLAGRNVGWIAAGADTWMDQTCP
jgi:Na+/proline symporter